MSFLNVIAKALGFSQGDDELTVEQHGDTPVNQQTAAPQREGSIKTQLATITDSEKENRNEQPDPSVLFEGMVEVINRELPPYLRESLNQELQMKYLYSRLENSLKEFVEKTAERTRKKAQEAIGKDQDTLKNKIHELQEKVKQAEEKCSKETEKSLSHERQKRSLTVKIKDLEGRVSALEAEKEQYELENKSLLNKLRVASVTGNSEHQSESNEELMNEVGKLKAEVEKLTGKLQELEKEKISLNEDNKKLSESLSLTDKKQKRLEELNRRLEKENSELKETTGVVNVTGVGEHPASYETVSFDTAPSIPEVKKDQESQPNSEKKRRKRKDKNKIDSTADENEQAETTPLINAIDDSLSSTDWLVFTQPDEGVKEKEGLKPSEFGYQEPPQKNDDINPAQMSLW